MRTRLEKLLARKTSTAYFIREIDGFRFYAIFAVLLYHLNTHLSRLFSQTMDPSYFRDSNLYVAMSQGGIGVNVFFAISGFILALPFARHHLFRERPVNLGSYYMRRITRLEPPYAISLILFLFVHVLILHEVLRDIFPNFLASLFYVHNVAFDRWSDINPVAWSLEVEVQFYILAPVLCLFFAIKRPIVRRVILIIVIVASMLHYNLNYDWIKAWHLRKSLLMHLHQFLTGLLFADFFLTSWRESLKERSYVYDVVGLAALALLLVFNSPFNFADDLIFSVCLFLSFVSLFKGKLINSFFTNRWIVVTGGMCYSIYLLHYAVIAFLVDGSKFVLVPGLGYAANFVLQMLIVIPIVLFVSGVFFVLIEKPCMDKEWPSRLKAKMAAIFAPQPQ